MLFIILFSVTILLRTSDSIITSSILICKNHLILLYKLYLYLIKKKNRSSIFPLSLSYKTLLINNTWYSDIAK